MIGTVIRDQYQIVEVIGEGGMGLVYKALDLELGRQVALKFLKAELAGNEILIQRFRDELRTLAGFNHPNITTLFTSVTWQDYPVMVMELLEGETLHKMVFRRGPIPASVCVPLITQALAGVGAAHRKKIIHRDLKPSNLMLTTDGVVKVMDFGIAKGQNGAGLTRSNMAIGTSLYMAPEQIMGQTADARTDIYSMGVTLYELLAGRVPFLGDSQYAIEHAHMQEIPELPTVYYPHIPANVTDAVMKALAKDPARRFQTAEEFATALGQSRPTPVPEPTVSALSATAAAPMRSVTPPPVSTPTPAPAASSPASTPEPAFVPPASQPQTPNANVTVPAVPPRKSGLAIALLAVAACLVLVVGGLWMRSATVPAAKTADVRTDGAGDGANGRESVSHPEQRPEDGGGQSKVSAKTTPDPEPFVIDPIKPSPRATPPQKGSSEVSDITPSGPTVPDDGLAGQWTGTYERCEDGSSTRIALKLTEPSPGRVTGSLRFSAPDGTSGRCSMDGVILGQGTKVSLKADVCAGTMPAYFAPGHESLLNFAGAELSGTVEPQTPCMTISLRKSGN